MLNSWICNHVSLLLLAYFAKFEMSIMKLHSFSPNYQFLHHHESPTRSTVRILRCRIWRHNFQGMMLESQSWNCKLGHAILKSRSCDHRLTVAILREQICNDNHGSVRLRLWIEIPNRGPRSRSKTSRSRSRSRCEMRDPKSRSKIEIHDQDSDIEIEDQDSDTQILSRDLRSIFTLEIASSRFWAAIRDWDHNRNGNCDRYRRSKIKIENRDRKSRIENRDPESRLHDRHFEIKIQYQYSEREISDRDSEAKAEAGKTPWLFWTCNLECVDIVILIDDDF
jgi:hypothetical protein